jgi:hypothetical protein
MIRFKAPGMVMWKTVLFPVEVVENAKGQIVIKSKFRTIVLPAATLLIFRGKSQKFLAARAE